jgi:hypothetical protein
MSIEIPSLTDPEVMVSVPVQMRGGRVYMTTRADSRAAADEAAVGAGLMLQRTREDGSTYLVEPATVSRVPVGPVVITPGTYDEEGNDLTAPVIDSRHHDNWLLTPTQMHASGRPLWEVTVLSWVANGSPLPQANAAEQGVRYGTVELIDPETISSPSVVVQ